jgi:hypothetical protein
MITLNILSKFPANDREKYNKRGAETWEDKVMTARPKARRRSIDPKHLDLVERTHGLSDALYSGDVHAQRLAAL